MPVFSISRGALTLTLLVIVGALTACGGANPYQQAQSTAAVAAVDAADNATGTGGNEFLPERENITDCVGTVERPDCGSKIKGGWQMYLTFAVLIAGMSFIGWRVTKGVRARDNAINTADTIRS